MKSIKNNYRIGYRILKDKVSFLIYFRYFKFIFSKVSVLKPGELFIYQPELYNNLTNVFTNIQFQIESKIKANEIGLVSPYSLGDVYLLCTLSTALKQKFKNSKIILFVKPQHQFIPWMFTEIDEVRLISKDFSIISNYGYDENASPGKIVYAYFRGPQLSTLLGYKKINLLDLFKTIVGVPYNCPLSQPKITSLQEFDFAKQYFLKNELIIGKTVILCPDAVSVPTISYIFWELLVIELKARNFVVVCNMGPNTKPVNNTIPLNIPLNNFRTICQLAGWVIALRSGLCDLLSVAGCKLCVLYPRVFWSNGSLFEGSNLSSMGLTSRADEFEINPIFDQDIDIYDGQYQYCNKPIDEIERSEFGFKQVLEKIIN